MIRKYIVYNPIPIVSARGASYIVSGTPLFDKT